MIENLKHLSNEQGSALEQFEAKDKVLITESADTVLKMQTKRTVQKGDPRLMQDI